MSISRFKRKIRHKILKLRDFFGVYYFYLIMVAWNINGLSFNLFDISFYRGFEGTLLGVNTDFRRYLYFDILFFSIKVFDFTE